MQKIKDFAYARSGDKGSCVNIGVIALNKESYLFLLVYLTEERVKSYFSHLNPQRVLRYELPNLNALNFILEGVLDGGGSLNLAIDAQGKALGHCLLQMEIENE